MVSISRRLERRHSLSRNINNNPMSFIALNCPSSIRQPSSARVTSAPTCDAGRSARVGSRRHLRVWGGCLLSGRCQWSGGQPRVRRFYATKPHNNPTANNGGSSTAKQQVGEPNQELAAATNDEKERRPPRKSNASASDATRR